MANLKDTTIDSNLITKKIKNGKDEDIFDMVLISDGGFYTRKIVNRTITGIYNTSSGRRVFSSPTPAFDKIEGFKPGSLIDLFFHVPTYNGTYAYGGFYVEPQVKFNEGKENEEPWYSLGGSGYDIMYLDAYTHQHYNNNVIFFLPEIEESYDLTFNFYFSQYDNYNRINNNALTGVSNVGGGYIHDELTNDHLQHYFSIKVEELARFD